MSSIDFGNPKVLKNYINSQIEEGKGKLEVKKEVLVFKSDDGNVYVAPDELQKKLKAKLAKEEVKEEEVEKEVEKKVEKKKVSKKKSFFGKK